MMTTTMRSVLAGAGALVLLTGCGLTGASGFKTSTTDLSDWFTVTSSAFTEGAPIPARFACPAYAGGLNKTPPLHWSGEPTDTQAYAIVVDDPNAPHGTYIHWVIANIDGTVGDMVEGAQIGRTVDGQNSSGTVGYLAPCPPKGDRPHQYRFTVYALSGKVTMKQGAPLTDSLPEIARLTIGRGRLTGNFGGR
jgi:Raf kinase inhibitor-like YbhB/YbcL family protein